MLYERIKKFKMECLVVYLLTHSRIMDDEVYWTDKCPKKAIQLIRLAGSIDNAKAICEDYMRDRKEATNLIELIANL